MSQRKHGVEDCAPSRAFRNPVEYALRPLAAVSATAAALMFGIAGAWAAEPVSPEQIMNALAPNDLSDAVRSPFGWHLIQVLERRTGAASSDRRRMEARRAIRDRKADEAYEEWVRQLRDRAYVEYRLDDR